MIKKGLSVLFFLFILLPLTAEISQIPEAQLLIDQAMEKYENEEFKESLDLFKKASLLDQENLSIQNIILSLERIISLENYDSDSEIIDRFIREKEEEKEKIKDEPEGNDNLDFLNKEKNKEIARQERPLGGVSFHLPLFYSSQGSWVTDNSMAKNNDPFKGISYSLNFFPDLFNRIIGIEGKYESYPLVSKDTLYIYDEARIGVVLKNYFREQPGSYSLLGTKISVGVLYGENTVNNSRKLYPAWQFELFVRDPFLYRLAQNDFTKRLNFEGKFQFSLLDITYMLGYGLTLDFTMGDFQLSSQFLYRGLMEQDILNSSWLVSGGIKYYFR